MPDAKPDLICICECGDPESIHFLKGKVRAECMAWKERLNHYCDCPRFRPKGMEAKSAADR